MGILDFLHSPPSPATIAAARAWIQTLPRPLASVAEQMTDVDAGHLHDAWKHLNLVPGGTLLAKKGEVIFGLKRGQVANAWATMIAFLIAATHDP